MPVIRAYDRLAAELLRIAAEQKVRPSKWAAASGITKQTISHLRHGRNRVEFYTLLQLADALGYELTLTPKEKAPE